MKNLSNRQIIKQTVLRKYSLLGYKSVADFTRMRTSGDWWGQFYVSLGMRLTQNHQYIDLNFDKNSYKQTHILIILLLYTNKNASSVMISVWKCFFSLMFCSVKISNNNCGDFGCHSLDCLSEWLVTNSNQPIASKITTNIYVNWEKIYK